MIAQYQFTPRRELGRYTLTLDPDVALSGLSFPNEQDQAFAGAHAFRPLAAPQMEDVRRRAMVAPGQRSVLVES